MDFPLSLEVCRQERTAVWYEDKPDIAPESGGVRHIRRLRPSHVSMTTVSPTRRIVGLTVRSLPLVTSGIRNSGFLYRSGHHMGLRQDANPRVSLAAADLATRTSRHRSWDHSKDRRTLVIHSLDDGRSSQVRAPAVAFALKSRGDCSRKGRETVADPVADGVDTGPEKGRKPDEPR